MYSMGTANLLGGKLLIRFYVIKKFPLGQLSEALGTVQFSTIRWSSVAPGYSTGPKDSLKPRKTSLSLSASLLSSAFTALSTLHHYRSLSSSPY